MPVLTVEAMPVVQPVTIECVAEVSRQYQIPVALLGGVLAQERGRLGQSSLNKNGTWDIGPMQVNSAWLKFFAPNGIDQHRLQHDGCANRRRHYNHPHGQGRVKGDLWRAVGRYHSHQPGLAAAYQGKVVVKVGELNSGRQTLARSPAFSASPCPTSTATLARSACAMRCSPWAARRFWSMWITSTGGSAIRCRLPALMNPKPPKLKRVAALVVAIFSWWLVPNIT